MKLITLVIILIGSVIGNNVSVHTKVVQEQQGDVIVTAEPIETIALGKYHVLELYTKMIATSQ